MQPNAPSSAGTPEPERPRPPLTRVIRSSLNAKLERLLARPLFAGIESSPQEEPISTDDGPPTVLVAWQSFFLHNAPSSRKPRRTNRWEENQADGTWTVPIEIDYDDLWRGKEKEIAETIKNTVESPITYLTEEQARLLRNSPREFLALNPRPETTELVSFDLEPDGRVVRLTVASLPKSADRACYFAVVPNLVQIQRQLDALEIVDRAAGDGPLAPLRSLVGLGPLPVGYRETSGPLSFPEGERKLDEFQADAVQKAITTPHFAVIHGPPGSGKTTVISSVIKRAVGQGEKVLVVSPTHVAVDNVVEKLVGMANLEGRDCLEPHTIPVRYAARRGVLSAMAREYWVGNKERPRDATVSKRLQKCLSTTLPSAALLYANEDTQAAGLAPLSQAVAEIERVICGTPIGILSYAPVKNASPAAYDLLVVDEVSKMTLPEFLAIAVKARRWVLVGDPEQLPPFQDSADNATTLDEVLPPLVELACSVGAILENSKPSARTDERLLVVALEPTQAAIAIRAHLQEVGLERTPKITVFGEAHISGVIVCRPAEVQEASEQLLPVAIRDRTLNPDNRGGLRILVERGQSVARPQFASGTRFVDERERAQAKIFEVAFNVYHSQPWAQRNRQKLSTVSLRNGLSKYLPSTAALSHLAGFTLGGGIGSNRVELLAEIASFFAVNTVSVYDWLTGIPSQAFDVSPLLELKDLLQGGLNGDVQPYVGKLQKQYRMHASLSEVPRELFYSGQALLDGRSDADRKSHVMLIQVDGEATDEGEVNKEEGETICELLKSLSASKSNEEKIASVMVITPYRRQMDFLSEKVAALRAANAVTNLSIETLTLDRCQGREADYVLISLVRDRASQFFEMPKRWNVALTRAKEALVLVGNIDAFITEARAARRNAPPSATGYNREDNNDANRPKMSLLARIIESYQLQDEKFKRLGTTGA